MKRSAPTPTQLAVPAEAPCLSLGVIRTALIGLAAVLLLLLGLFYFFRARAHHTAPLASPRAAHAPALRMALNVSSSS
jgi:hypothetical protein